ncbi:MAG: LuxR C-terminal-related transcriptional regulator [Pseudomonadota bacterium]
MIGNTARTLLVGGLLGFQLVCALLFLFNILSSITGIGQFSWLVHELIELGAAVGLFLGVGLGAITLRRTMRRNKVIEEQLRAASGAFMEVLEDRFTTWNLTPAERDVALFAIKGMSTAEIAALRGVSEGTIKAQTNAIYRKAGVSGRTQLLSLFIDDLIADPVT